METTKELRELLQSEKINPVGWKRPWGYKTLQRGPSIYLTRLVIQYNLLPNQITLAGIAAGAVGSFLVFGGNSFGMVVGTFLLYLNILADKVDGEVARYRIHKGLGGVHLRGVYLDELNHLVIPGMFLASVMLGIGRTFPYTTSFLEIMGSAAALSIVFIRAWHGLPMQILLKKYLKHPQNFAPLGNEKPEAKIEKIKAKSGIVRELIKILNHLQDFLLIVLLFFLAFLAEAIFPVLRPHLASGLLLVAFGVALPLIALKNFVKGFYEVEARIKELEETIRKGL
ncbi:MAG: CDP-alcohol phosphatidyltransferase family protein [Patescibacteria group bacterium]